MRLVLIGAYTLDELQEEVVRSFADVPASPRQPSPLEMKRSDPWTWNERCRSPVAECGMPFLGRSLGCVYRIVPVKDWHKLTITWQVPPLGKHWRSKPCDYVAHVLGHEAAGSILSSLKARSWVTSCYAGVGTGGYENASSHALFQMALTLSKEGVSHWKEIISEVYAYIGMLRHYCSTEEGLPGWIYEELKAIQDISYKFGDEMSPSDLVENIAYDLAPGRDYPPERILDGASLLVEHDAAAIKDLVDNFLTPSNSRVDFLSSKFGRASDYDNKTECGDDGSANGDIDRELFDSFTVETAGKLHMEPRFGTRFWCHPISGDVMQTWTRAAEAHLPSAPSMLSLPPLNPYVPTKFDLKPLSEDDVIDHHPLLHCSLRVCISVDGSDTWFPATVTKFDSTENQILLSYHENEREAKWHRLDLAHADVAALDVAPNLEGTLDDKSVKFQIVSVPLQEGREGAALANGSGEIEEETFPTIPPPLPESRHPQLVSDTEILKLWHLQDRKFKRPTAELRLKLVCADANRTPFHRSCADLFVLLCGDAMTETSYLASVCELGSSMGVTDVGFSLRVHGFDHKLLDLSRTILNMFLSFRGREGGEGLPSTIKNGRFDACLEILRRRYMNQGMQASSLCNDVRLRCIRPTIWSSSSKAASLRAISVSSFVSMVSRILNKISVEGLFHGNVDRSDAEAAKTLISEALETSGSGGLPKKKYPAQHVLKAPLAHDHTPVVTPTKDPKEPNTAVEVYFQVGPDNLAQRVLIDLLTQIMYEPLFDQLRTKEQFGYQVSCGARWTFGVMGMSFTVVTSCKSAVEVSDRLEKFLLDFWEELNAMKHDTFMENLIGLAKMKLQMFNSLEEETSSLWTEITEGRYNWDIYREEVVCLRSITKAQVMSAFDKWLLPKCKEGRAKQRRRLVVHVIGTTEGPASFGRPSIESEKASESIDDSVSAFHAAAGHSTWGKIF